MKRRQIKIFALVILGLAMIYQFVSSVGILLEIAFQRKTPARVDNRFLKQVEFHQNVVLVLSAACLGLIIYCLIKVVKKKS